MSLPSCEAPSSACFLWFRMWNLYVGGSIVPETLQVLPYLRPSEHLQKQDPAGQPLLCCCEFLGTSIRLIKVRGRTQWSLEPGTPDNQPCFDVLKFRVGRPPGPTLHACLFLSLCRLF